MCGACLISLGSAAGFAKAIKEHSQCKWGSALGRSLMGEGGYQTMYDLRHFASRRRSVCISRGGRVGWWLQMPNLLEEFSKIVNNT